MRRSHCYDLKGKAELGIRVRKRGRSAAVGLLFAVSVLQGRRGRSRALDRRLSLLPSANNTRNLQQISRLLQSIEGTLKYHLR